VWANLTAAYPPNHFTTVVKECILGEGLLDQGTYDELISLVDNSIKKQLAACEETLDEARQKLSYTETLRKNDRRNLLKERDDHADELEKLREYVKEESQEWVKKELTNRAVIHDKEKELMKKKL